MQLSPTLALCFVICNRYTRPLEVKLIRQNVWLQNNDVRLVLHSTPYETRGMQTYSDGGFEFNILITVWFRGHAPIKADTWKSVLKTLNSRVTVAELQLWPSDLTMSRGTPEGFEWLGRAAHSKQQTHDPKPFFIYFLKLQPTQPLEKKRGGTLWTSALPVKAKVQRQISGTVCIFPDEIQNEALKWRWTPPLASDLGQRNHQQQRAQHFSRRSDKKPKRLFLLPVLMCYSWPDLWPHQKDLLNLQRSSFIPLPAAHFPPLLRRSYGQWLREVVFWEKQHAKSLCIVSTHVVWCSLPGSMIKHGWRLNIICKLKHEALVGILAQKFSSPAGK